MSDYTPILLTTEIFDTATIISHGDEDSGYPVEQMQDPRPRAAWKVDRSFTTKFFVVDLGDDVDDKGGYDTVWIGFANPFPNQDVFRIRTGTASSGTGVSDSGNIFLWSFPGSDPLYGYTSSIFYWRRDRGTHTFYRFPSLREERYMRVDFTTGFGSVPESYFTVGRFACGRALEPLVLYGSGTPTPVGSPPKLVNTWDALLSQEQIEEIAYALALDRGSSPRVIRSWGGDISLLDGAKPVVMCNNVDAPDAWTRHQASVYGYLDPINPIQISAFDEYRTNITVRGL